MILINGIDTAAIDPCDRGFAYGDGVFRTLALRGGRPLLWSRQYAKLAHDAAALKITCPDAQVLFADLAAIAARHADGVIRITLTRGIAPRGYTMQPDGATTRAVAYSAPAFVTATAVRARWCTLRLAIQPALAGIKHLNRLENVLARAEWQDSSIAEGLLKDANGNVIGGTMCNLFLLRDGVLTTPVLDACGIAGVMRDLILEYAQADGIVVRIAPVLPAEVRAADALFLVNSLIGVWQITALDDLSWPEHAMAARMREWITDAEAC
jgi:4-amino-4-deoxychorismate lyase